jgi:hypothetical protein
MPSERRDRAAKKPAPEDGKAAAALRLMEQALQLIDDNGGPDDAGAILDQAIHRLRSYVATTRH